MSTNSLLSRITRRAAAVVTMLILCSPVLRGEVSLSINDDGLLVFTGQGEEANGLDLISPAGALVPSSEGDASPFMFYLSRTPNQVTWGNLGTGVTLDGPFVTDVGFRGDPDLTAAWGNGNSPGPITIDASVLSYDCGDDCPEFVGRPSIPLPPNPIIPPDPIVEGPQPPGNIQLNVNDDGYLVFSGTGQRVGGIDVQSPAGRLVPPAPPGRTGDPAPFQFFLSSTPNQVVWGNLGTAVTIDGSWTSGLGYQGDPDLTAFWGDGPDPVPIDIAADVLSFDCGANCLVADPVVPPVTPTNPPAPGELPSTEGLPVSTDVVLTLDANNRFVLSADAIQMSGVDIVSASGSLDPIATGPQPSGGGLSCNSACAEEAAPFSFFLSNNEQRITLGKLGTVLIDGSITLAAGLDPNGIDDVTFFWGDGPQAVVGQVSLGPFGDSVPFISVDETRSLVPHNLDGDVTSISFTSSAGVLDSLDVPDAWSVVSDSDSEITLTHEGISPEDLSNLGVSWGASVDNEVYVSFSLASGQSYGPFPVAATAVPEPSGATLMLLSLLGLLGRRRRSVVD